MLPATEAASLVFADLVRRAATGDRAAVERLLMHAQEVAYRFSLLVCGHPEDAEDVMQEALIKTYQHVSQITQPEAFRTWLYTTVKNICLMKRRRRAGEPSRHLSIERPERTADDDRTAMDVPDTRRSPEQQLEGAWAGRRLQRALHALPAPYRAILVMREIEGLSTREVAEVFGISQDNVKTRLHRARVMLRKRLDHELHA